MNNSDRGGGPLRNQQILKLNGKHVENVFAEVSNKFRQRDDVIKHAILDLVAWHGGFCLRPPPKKKDQSFHYAKHITK
jgi:hypothetical protein